MFLIISNTFCVIYFLFITVFCVTIFVQPDSWWILHKFALFQTGMKRVEHCLPSACVRVPAGCPSSGASAWTSTWRSPRWGPPGVSGPPWSRISSSPRTPSHSSSAPTARPLAGPSRSRWSHAEPESRWASQAKPPPSMVLLGRLSWSSSTPSVPGSHSSLVLRRSGHLKEGDPFRRVEIVGKPLGATHNTYYGFCWLTLYTKALRQLVNRTGINRGTFFQTVS